VRKQEVRHRYVSLVRAACKDVLIDKFSQIDPELMIAEKELRLILDARRQRRFETRIARIILDLRVRSDGGGVR
jgi:hypothetical protein